MKAELLIQTISPVKEGLTFQAMAPPVQNTPVPLGMDSCLPTDEVRALLVAFLSGRKETTLKAYRQDLQDFAKFLCVNDPVVAIQNLLSYGCGKANAKALGYRSEMLDRKLKAATINRRLAALRSVVKMGRTLGYIAWALEVQGLKSRPYRDTRGPGISGFKMLVQVARTQRIPLACRDTALLYLLRYLGLRRGEVAQLNIEDIDLDRGAVAILGKGENEKQWITLPDKTKAALSNWMEAHGNQPGPLFINFHHNQAKRNRITGSGLWYIVQTLGRRCGIKIRPHGLRHLCATDALEKTNGNYDLAARITRHKDIRVMRQYNDAREDRAGKLGNLMENGDGIE